MENNLDNLSKDELKNLKEELELYNLDAIPLTEEQIENFYEQVKMNQVFKFHPGDLIDIEENKHTK